MNSTRADIWQLPRRAARQMALMIAALAAAACAHAPAAPNEVVVDANGTVHVPAMSVPVSGLLSPEGNAYLVEHLIAMRTPEQLALVEEIGGPLFLKAYLDRQKERFPVTREDTQIAGVHVYDYKPSAGISAENKDRVLINLHGGGFMGCWPACAELESMPLAGQGLYRVVAVDYRQGPEHKFPAASEDVAKVYAELLKTYPAQNIGIYGCSAGGMLTGMSVAWFQKHGLPSPGAVGIYCAGLAAPLNGFGGDANFTATAIGEGRFMVPPEVAAADAPKRSGMPYLSDADPYDPLVAPAESDEVLARFPATQIITGTRAFELSSAVYTHSRLVKLGVPADLHVWEGMFHGFFYNTDVPESRDAIDIMIKFFDTHLGGASPASAGR